MLVRPVLSAGAELQLRSRNRKNVMASRTQNNCSLKVKKSSEQTLIRIKKEELWSLRVFKRKTEFDSKADDRRASSGSYRQLKAPVRMRSMQEIEAEGRDENKLKDNGGAVADTYVTAVRPCSWSYRADFWRGERRCI